MSWGRGFRVPPVSTQRPGFRESGGRASLGFRSKSCEFAARWILDLRSPLPVVGKSPIQVVAAACSKSPIELFAFEGF